MSKHLLFRPQQETCSIKCLENQSPHQELLLYTNNRNKTIEEESQGEPFHLYITPHHHKEEYEWRNELNTEEQTMEQTNKQEEPSKQLEEDRDTVRLKAIISKKNRTIDQVTEQLRRLGEQVRRLKKMNRKQQNKSSRSERDKRTDQQLVYLQRNNLELFEELKTCKKQKDALEKQLFSCKQTIKKLTVEIKELQNRNKHLKEQNDSLLQKTKQYLTEGQKEIKYLNKIKEIFYQKTGIESFIIPVKSCTYRNNPTKSKQNKRMQSAEKNGKQKSVQPFLLENSNTTLKKDHNHSNRNRQNDSSATDIRHKQRVRVSGSLDLQKCISSQRTLKSSKLMYSHQMSRKL